MDNGKVMRKDGVRTSESEMSYFQFADVVTTGTVEVGYLFEYELS